MKLASMEFGTRALMTTTEAEILHFLYEEGKPVSSGDIMFYIINLYQNNRRNMPSPGGITTMLNRMTARGILKKTRRDRGYVYKPSGTKVELLTRIAFETGITLGIIRRNDADIHTLLKKYVKENFEAMENGEDTVEEEEFPVGYDMEED